MKSCLLGWLMNDHTCTMCRYSAKQKFFGTKNTKQIPLFTTKVFLLYTKREVLWNSLQNRFSGLPNQMLKRASKDCQRNLFIDFSKIFFFLLFVTLLSFSLNKFTIYTSWSLSLINWNYIQLGTFYSYVSLTTDFLWAIKLLNVWDLAHIPLLYRTVGTKTSNKSIGSIFLSLVSQLYFLD